MTEQEIAERTDHFYNTIASELSDWGDAAEEPYGYGGKRIPYIGWFWRWCYFTQKWVTIGDCGSFIGVMMSNKWDYPSRKMTPEEVDTFIAFLNRANNPEEADVALREMWDWFQTLKVEE